LLYPGEHNLIIKEDDDVFLGVLDLKLKKAPFAKEVQLEKETQ
jgi:hypothetical protein